MSEIKLKSTDSFAIARVVKEGVNKGKYIEVEFNEVIGEDIANIIISMAGIIGDESGAKPEEVLLDIITSISTGPMISKMGGK